MIILNYICILISLLVFLWLYITDVKKSLCQNVMLLTSILSELGFLFLTKSENMETALLATKIAYISGVFIPMLYFFTITEICHISLKKRVIVPLAIVQIIIYGFALTIGYSDLYYKNVNVIFVNGTIKVVKEYGILHICYPVMMACYYMASILVVIWAVFKKKTVNKKELRKTIIFAGIALFLYLIQRLTGYDIMMYSNLLLIMGALGPIYSSNLYTVNENMNIVHEQMKKVGFITFNNKLEYMGCNDFAAWIFKELESYTVGRVIEHPSSQLQEIIEEIKYYDKSIRPNGPTSHNHKKIDTLKKNDRRYDAVLHTVNNFFGYIKGYTVEFRDETEHYRVMELTEKYNEELTNEVNEKTKKILSIQEKTIIGMARMVESRDLSTGGHIMRTSDVVRIFSKKIFATDKSIDRDFLKLVIRSAPMHDLGKIGVDDAILRKQGRFTDAEYEEMKKHAAIGGKMVEDILGGVEEEDFVRIAKNVANYHHERMDGTGYPCGLKGEEIPLEARIMALADVFDALVSKRCYKEAYSYDKAFSIIEEEMGTHFDKRLAKIFLSCRSELEEYYNECE